MKVFQSAMFVLKVQYIVLQPIIKRDSRSDSLNLLQSDTFYLKEVNETDQFEDVLELRKEISVIQGSLADTRQSITTLHVLLLLLISILLIGSHFMITLSIELKRRKKLKKIIVEQEKMKVAWTPYVSPIQVDPNLVDRKSSRSRGSKKYKSLLKDGSKVQDQNGEGVDAANNAFIRTKTQDPVIPAKMSVIGSKFDANNNIEAKILAGISKNVYKAMDSDINRGKSQLDGQTVGSKVSSEPKKISLLQTLDGAERRIRLKKKKKKKKKDDWSNQSV